MYDHDGGVHKVYCMITQYGGHKMPKSKIFSETKKPTAVAGLLCSFKK